MTEPEQVPGRLDVRYRAFLETVAQLRPKLHRYCARMTGSTMDGEDVVQDALFEGYRKLDTYDDTRPLSPWLFRIAHNRCIDFLRRREARARAEDAVADDGVTDPVDPPGPALGRAVEHLVQHLPPKERASVLLKDVFDYTLEEIAGLTESTPGGVKAALHRGRQKLQALQPEARTPSGASVADASRRDAALTPEAEQLLQLYVERFNRRDWDGLRALIAADATLRVTDWYEGLLRESAYFTRYAQFAPLVARLSAIDGEPAIALYRDASTPTPHALLRIAVRGGQIAHITDYTHCPWMNTLADVSPHRASA
jgi:RNA polymerase sigma-70 factor, ECF subfamily